MPDWTSRHKMGGGLTCSGQIVRPPRRDVPGLPVRLHRSDRVVSVPVEVQLRTVAMDFWASLEHRLVTLSGLAPGRLPLRW